MITPSLCISSTKGIQNRMGKKMNRGRHRGEEIISSINQICWTLKLPQLDILFPGPSRLCKAEISVCLVAQSRFLTLRLFAQVWVRRGPGEKAADSRKSASLRYGIVAV
jgi:hypothetical protein